MTRRLALFVGLFAMAFSSVAHAQDKKACLAAVDEGQNLRDQGKLGAAKAQFQICTSKACPTAVIKQCNDWYAEVERDQPSVLFRVKDEAGKEVFDVKVLVDGAPIADSVGGQPLAVDPGARTFRVERKDGKHAELKALVRDGEKARLIELEFQPDFVPAPAATTRTVAAPSAPAAAQRGFEIPLLGWVGGGVFVAGAATTAIFAVMANGDESDLRSSCAPRCSDDDRDGIKTKLVVANVGMFVGIAGLALAGVTTFLANRTTRVGITANGIRGTF